MGGISYTAHISQNKSAITSKTKLEGVAKHNLRKYKSTDYSADKIILLYGTNNLLRDVKRVYKEEFGDAVKRYNEKQNREDRKIKDYFNYVSEKGQDMAVEIIFQCGDKEFWDSHEEDKQLMEAVYQKILKWLQIYLPDYKVANAVVHLDETSPHMHVVGVPVGRGFKNGPETKVSKRSVFTKETLSVVLQDKLRKVANDYTRLYLRENIREKGKGRNHDLSVAEYQLAQTEKKYETTKTQVAEQEKRSKELTGQIDEKEQVLADKLENEEIIDIMTKEKIDEKEKLEKDILLLQRDTRYVEESMWEYEKGGQYQLREPEAFMSAKSYKEKIVMPLFYRFKEVVRGLLGKIGVLRAETRKLEDENDRLIGHIEDLKWQLKFKEREVMEYVAKGKDLDDLKAYIGEDKLAKMVEEAREYVRLEEERKRINEEDRIWKRTR